MANEITFAYVTGVVTLTYGAYQPDGTVRTAAATALSEVGATGYYKASDANVVAGDLVIVKHGTVVVGGGEYLPAVTAVSGSVTLATIEAKIDTIDGVVDGIDTNVDLILVAENKVLNVYTENKPISVIEVQRI